jgi:peptidoglycan LD-endopeptidase CwlK
MPTFSTKSLNKLNTCDHRLQLLFKEVVKHIDCTILEGHRPQERQDMLFEQGQSKLKYPNGKHNATPSQAVDVAPYPIDWNNKERFILFAGIVQGIALQMNIGIRWGGDWNGDYDTKDTNFFDAPHFELLV